MQYFYINHFINILIKTKYSMEQESPADKLIKIAEEKIGCDYEYGAAGPDKFDCSGLVQWCHAQINVTVPRTSGEQYSQGSAATGAKGDLVFFKKQGKINHVGICDGNGNMINAQNSGVKKVKISNVKPNWGMGDNCGYKKFL